MKYSDRKAYIVEYMRSYRKTDTYKKAHEKHIDKWRSMNRDKYKAHTMVNNAVAAGKIAKPTCCSVCLQETRIIGHHPDYSKPLEVIWLCDACHKSEHKKMNAEMEVA